MAENFFGMLFALYSVTLFLDAFVTAPIMYLFQTTEWKTFSSSDEH